MDAVHCLPWLKSPHEKISGISSLNSKGQKRLPEDVLLEILSRLPAKLVIDCMAAYKPFRTLMATPSFVDMHFNQSAPVIAFSYPRRPWSTRSVYVSFTYEKAKSITTERKRLKHYGLICSFNGFILFRVKDAYGYCSTQIWNPLTQQEKTVFPLGDVYGFYIYPPTMEYRLLFLRAEVPHVRFFTYGLMSQCSTTVADFTHPPAMEKTGVTLNGALHWMVNDCEFKEGHGVWPDCSDAIVLFNIIAENWSTMRHPGSQCGLRKKHAQMEVMEMKGYLWFCDTSSNTELDIWVLEDYNNRIWAKRHVIMIESLISFCGIQISYGSDETVGGFYGFNDELLLKVSNKHLILYNLQLGTMRRVGPRKDKIVTAIPHVDSLFLNVF